MFGTRCSTEESLVFETGKKLKDLRSEFQSMALTLEGVPDYSEDVRKFFRFYGMDIPCKAHYFGSVKSGRYDIAAHVFVPQSALKTVFLLHGYVTSSFIFNHFIPRLLERNIATCAIDLPGHGFSSGVPGGIEDFKEYAEMISDLLEYVHPYLPEPYAIIGHSTGCAAIIEYMHINCSAFEKHVLVAPLIRSDLYDLSRFGYTLFGWAMSEVPTLPRDSSSDKAYLAFVRKQDPLIPRKVPIRWAKALYDWNSRLDSSRTITEKSILIVQGTRDVVLEYKSNLAFLKKFAPEASIIYLDNAKHDIFQEKEPIRKKLYEYILDYFDAQ